MTKIACYSDLHGTLPNKPTEEVDFVIFAGDIMGHNPNATYAGTRSDNEFQIAQLLEQWVPFWKSFGTTPVIVIWGNHDIIMDSKLCDRNKRIPKSYIRQFAEAIEGSNIHCLQCAGVELPDRTGKVIKFWGSPHVPYIGGMWAFEYPPYVGLEFASKLYADIPTDTDVVITHCPPAGIGDGSHYGCTTLTNLFSYTWHPKAHVCGHVHEGRGVRQSCDTQFINAANSGGGKYDGVLEADGNPYHVQSADPIYFEI